MNTFHKTIFAAVALVVAGSIFAAEREGRHGQIHITKECSENHGAIQRNLYRIPLP